MKSPLFKGTHTALVTPFYEGKICYQSLERLLDLQINAKVQSVVVLGTTGESPTVNAAERLELIKFIQNYVNNRIPVVIGTGHYSTEESIKLSKQAEDLGAAGIMLVTPYYNKPSQEGLFLHFSEVAKNVELPILVYTNPGRCGIQVEAQTFIRLRNAYPHICGVKDASGSCDYISALRKAMDEDFVINSGDDSMTLPYMSVGAQGLVSVIANLIPQEMVTLVEKASANDFLGALAIHERYYSLFKAQSLEVNPVPIKYCLWKMGVISSPEVRLPLAQMTSANQVKMDELLQILQESVPC